MFIQMLSAWTICILLLVFPRSTVGANRTDSKTLTTLYDVVTNQCPNLEATNLKENEIFTKKCLNWPEINATSFFDGTTKSNVECLVLYEALLSFCRGMGDTLFKIKDLIPSTSGIKTSRYNINSVCNVSSNLYPSSNTEHNISSLIRNSNDCFLLCLNFGEDNLSDICKFAYFFNTFNVSKFTQHLAANAIHRNVNNPALGPVMASPSLNVPKSIASSTKPVQNIPMNASLDNTPKKLTASPENKTQELLVDKNQKLVQVVQKQELHLEEKVQGPNQPGADGSMQKPPTEVKGIHSQELAAAPPGEESNGDIQNKNAVLKQPTIKPNVPAEKSPVVVTPEKEDNQEYQEPEGDDPMGDKSPVVNNNNADQALGGGAMDPGDNVMKDEHGMPVDNDEPKTLPRKPDKVEDEAVNNYSTPEDDMDGDSYFFSYFAVIMCLVIVGYVGYHNRQKILALLLEGKKGRRSGRARRPNSANYHKLDTNLEEAISSSCTKSASNVIY